MNETTNSSPNITTPDQPPVPVEAPVRTAPEMPETPETPEEMRAAYAGWLERRGVDPVEIPHLTMNPQEYQVFFNAPENYQGYVKKVYGIPQEDQQDCQYAVIDIQPDDPSQPPEPKLVIVNEVDFGTAIDRTRIAADFQQPDTDPEDPNPSRPNIGGALITVDIGDTLEKSTGGLRRLANKVMSGQTTDPLSEHYGDIGIRAGDVAPGQKDAYVWRGAAVQKSVELTLALPSTYDSVCVVRGERREAANGKAAMAQIDNPTTVLKIEGENLKDLQQVYREMYRTPDFALTDEQRQARDELFNDYFQQQISSAARDNHARAQSEQEYWRRQQQPRARQLPHP